MLKRIKAGLILITLLIAVASFSYLLSHRMSKSCSSNILVYADNTGFGVYLDPKCTISATSIDWGNCSPGTLYDVLIYAFNDQGSNVTVAMNTSDWNPTLAADYISEGWNVSDEMLPNYVDAVVMSLNVSQDTGNVTDFSFTTNIYASTGTLGQDGVGSNPPGSGNNPFSSQSLNEAVQNPAFWVVVAVMIGVIGLLSSSKGSGKRRRRGATEGRERSGRGATEY